MLAARFKEAGKPLAIEDVPIPSPGPGDVLVEIKAAGICGSDVHYKRGDSSPAVVPLTLGHEGAGTIKEVGSDVTNVKVGENVIIHYVISCGYCKPCLQGFDNRCRNRISIGHDVDGTFAEFIKVPAKNALSFAKHVPIEWGAITACAVSTAFHAVERSGLKKGDTAVIFGVGGVGIHAVMWAKFFGAGKVIAVDLVDSKLEAAKGYGADLVINPSRDDVLGMIARETDGWGADVSIECSGSPNAMEQAIRAIKGRNRVESGTAVSVGLQTKPFQVEYWNIREGWITVSGDHTRFDLFRIIKLMESGRIDLSRSITHRIPLRDINEGIELVESRREHVERVVVDMKMK